MQHAIATAEVILRRDAPCAAARNADVAHIVRATLARSNVVFAHDARIALGVALVSDATIRTLNRTYRAKDAPTDVLSFADAFADAPAPGVDRHREGEVVAGTVSLGDIVIACATVERYATIDSVAPERAFTFVLAHGVLHLLGYNHSAMMFAIQDAVTQHLHETSAKSCAERG